MTAAERIVWFNGITSGNGPIAVSPADRGLLLGDGIFETVAVFQGVPFQLTTHLDRLMAGSAVLGLEIVRKAVDKAVAEVLSHNPWPSAVLRITATRGPADRGLAATGQPSLLVTLDGWPAFRFGDPARVIVSSVRRNEGSPASRLKSLSYADNILAAREAASQNADDAVLLNNNGRVACTTIANLFMARNGRLVTPPLLDGVLPGTIRKLVLECGAEEASIARADLEEADEIFLTNSIRLVRPVQELDRKPLAGKSGFAHRMLDMLNERIESECGRGAVAF